MRGLIDIWAGFPPWLRFGSAIVVLLIGTGFWFADKPKHAVITWCVGGVLLLFASPSGPEKKGYHDFLIEWSTFRARAD